MIAKRMQLLKWLCIVVTIGGAGLFGTRHMLVKRVESQMENRGLRWSNSNHDWLRLQWSDVNTPMGTVEHIRFDVSTAHLVFEDVDIDLTGRQSKNTASTEPAPNINAPASATETAINVPLRIDALNVHVRLGEHRIFEQPIQLSSRPRNDWTLSGSDTAGWDLVGQNLHMEAMGQSLDGIEVQLSTSPSHRAKIRIPNFEVSHSVLANEPMPLQPIEFEAVMTSNDSARITTHYGQLSAHIDLSQSNGGIDGSIVIPSTPLAKIANLFGPLVPEAEQMEMAGTIGLSGTFNGPPWVWSAVPQADGIRVSGGLPKELSDDSVRFTAAEQIHVVGPAIDGWTPLRAAGWLPEAAIAAEDIRFRTHPGYDLVAIQEAIEAAPNETRIRGGSTITQQLAKNLFLDGRRTLRRKFRELLLAMALENRMTKDGILQLYLNVVEFGPNIRGVDRAANAWFLKNPDQLTPREAAFLAAILPAPNAWHERITRTGKPPVVVVDRVLDRMRRKGVLSAELHRRERAKRLRIVPP